MDFVCSLLHWCPCTILLFTYAWKLTMLYHLHLHTSLLLSWSLVIALYALSSISPFTNPYLYHTCYFLHCRYFNHWNKILKFHTCCICLIHGYFCVMYFSQPPWQCPCFNTLVYSGTTKQPPWISFSLTKERSKYSLYDSISSHKDDQLLAVIKEAKFQISIVYYDSFCSNPCCIIFQIPI